jgi:hypothetical protein
VLVEDNRFHQASALLRESQGNIREKGCPEGQRIDTTGDAP